MFGGLFQREPERPFQAVVPTPPFATPDAGPETVETAPSGEWSVDEIEAAYQRALTAAESAVVDLEAAEAQEGASELSAPAAERPADPDGANLTAGEEPAPNVTARQILEALLFVGGRPLTSRQLADVLGGSTSPESVVEELERLSSSYRAEQRPYEVRLGEGGYQLALRADFEKVRARVFGVGPREVRLPQPALEVLALVAYQQPVTREAVETAGIEGAGNLLRQLVRRELIHLDRGADGDAYRTTGRFLQLFGLRSPADLPRPEAIERR